MANPYQSPNSNNAEKEKPSQLPDSAGLSEDACGNIGLTINIIRFASVSAAIISLFPIAQAWYAFRYYGLPDGWTFWHTLICFRVVYSPCWWLLATMMWKYTTSLGGLAKNGADDIEHVIERQAKMWLAGGLLAFVMLIGVALAYVASFASNSSG